MNLNSCIVLSLLPLFLISPSFSYAATVDITASVSGCGDGIVQSGEQCDGSNFDGLSCPAFGFGSGTLSCTASCTINTSACRVAESPSSSGGSGGRTFITRGESSVRMAGYAYPLAKVFILKDGQIALSTIADADGYFDVKLGNLSTGQYMFSWYAEDAQGRKSQLTALPVTIASDEAIEMKDIRVVPTIGIEKTEIVQGENLMLYGQGLAGSEIILSFKGLKDFFVKLYAGQDGAYQYALDTTSVASGMYEVSARSSVGNTNGIFGGAVSVFVGKKFAPPVAVGPSSDLNSDGRVSVADFSVLAFWYKKTGFPARIDLNSDGAITIVDFSIMAYQWNG